MEESLDPGIGGRNIPLVSVVIPTHNRASLMKEAVHSVQTQQGVGELFDIEVIVVDDGSEDETPQVAQSLLGVRYMRLPVNQGESAARNTGIQAARGKYVAFLDDDDLWLPQKLLMQVPLLESNPEIGAVYGQNWLSGEGLDQLWPDGQRAPSGQVFPDFLQEDFISINTVMVRREAFDKAGYFDPRSYGMQYYEFCLRLSYYVPFAFVPGNCGVQRVSSGGMWTRMVKEGTYEGMHKYVIEKALAMLPETPESDELREKARTALFVEITRALTSVGSRGWIGFDRVCNHIRSGLARAPAMLGEPSVRGMLIHCGRRISGGSSAPLRDVKKYCSAIGQGVRGTGGETEIRLKSLLANIWAGAARALESKSSFRKAGCAALIAILDDSRKLANRSMLHILAKAVLGSHLIDFLTAGLEGFIARS